MLEVWKVNECLGSWQQVRANVTPDEVDAYARQLRQSSVLSHTRSFVSWVVLPERREIARGEA